MVDPFPFALAAAAGGAVSVLAMALLAPGRAPGWREWLAAARAAEDAGEAVDVAALRSTGVLRLDPATASRIARDTLAAQDPAAGLDDVTVGALTVTVRAHDQVPLAFGGFLRVGSVHLATVATARLTAGYLIPSSRVPLPRRSLSMTG
jgi:hypothetical protein